MYTDSQKLQLIEAVLKTNDEKVLQELENLVANKGKMNQHEKGRFIASLGLLTNEEAEAMKQVIEENFEKVNPDDWK